MIGPVHLLVGSQGDKEILPEATILRRYWSNNFLKRWKVKAGLAMAVVGCSNYR